MRYLYFISMDDYFEIVKRARARGLKPGESMEEVTKEYMKEKNKKPIGATELTMDEMLKEQASQGKRALGIEVDNKGKSKYKIVKKKKEK